MATGTKPPMTDELVVLKAVRPTWCNLQLPQDVARVLGFTWGAPFQTVHFLASEGQQARVAASTEERTPSRFVATARLTEKMVFNLPIALAEHLGIQISMTRRGRTTDDMLVWFMPADQYYEYRQAARNKHETGSFSPGERPQVYVVRNWPRPGKGNASPGSPRVDLPPGINLLGTTETG